MKRNVSSSEVNETRQVAGVHTHSRARAALRQEEQLLVQQTSAYSRCVACILGASRGPRQVPREGPRGRSHGAAEKRMNGTRHVASKIEAQAKQAFAFGLADKDKDAWTILCMTSSVHSG
jgi:hypothetical protein